MLFDRDKYFQSGQQQQDDPLSGELGTYINPDGSKSTERSVTIESNGKYYNMPTLVKNQINPEQIAAGVGLTEEQQKIAIDRFKERGGFDLAGYATSDEAVAAAKARSDNKGKVKLPTSRLFNRDAYFQDTVMQNLEEVAGKDPAAFKEAFRISQELNLPLETVERNLDRLKKRAPFSQVDINKYKVNNPVMWEALRDRQRAAIMHTDLTSYESIEETWKGIKDYGSLISDSFTVGSSNVRQSQIGFKRLMALKGLGDDATPEELAELAELAKAGQGVHARKEDTSFLGGVVPAAAEQLPILYDIFGEGLTYGATGFGIGAGIGATGAVIAGQLGPQVVVPEEVVTVPATALAVGSQFGHVGFRAGVAKGAFELEAGLALNEFLQIDDVNPDVAADAAIAVGLINASLESISLGFLGRTLTPVKQAMMQRIKRAMGTETGREIISSLAGRYMAAVAAEGITEFFQEFSNILGSEMLKVYGDSDFGDDQLNDVISSTLSDENIDRMFSAGKQGVQATMLLGGAGTTVSAVVEHQVRKVKTGSEQVRIDDIAAAVQEMSENVDGTDSLKTYMQEVIDNYGGDDTVYIPVENLDLEALAEFEGEAFEIIRNQVEEAKSTGADIVIPMSLFANDVMTNEKAYSILRDDIRLATDTLTNNEAALVDADHVAKVQQLIEEANQNTDMLTEANQVWEQVTQQLIATGRQPENIARVSASIIPAYVTTRAARTGKTVPEVYAELGLQIVGPQGATPEGRELNQAGFCAVCDRLRRTPEGEAKWQHMMETEVDIDEAKFLENVDVSEILDEGETWEQYKEANPDITFHEADGEYFFQTAGFEFIWNKDRPDLIPDGVPEHDATEAAESFDYTFDTIEEVNSEELVTHPAVLEASDAVGGEPTVKIETPERQQKRDDIADNLYGEGAVNKDKKIIFIYGPPASGKSTLANTVVKDNGALLVDSDLAKEQLPEFEGGKGADRVHEESQIIANTVLKYAISQGDNIVMPVVGKSAEKVQAQVQRMRDEGYTVEARFVDLPVEKTLKRALMRWKTEGRFIPIEYILDTVGNNPARVYAELTSKGVFDHAEAFSSDVKFGDPLIPVTIEITEERDTESTRLGRLSELFRQARSERGREEDGTKTLEQRGVDQTETPEFKEWFGDSKVVDENGEPLVVYHGSPRAGFDAFTNWKNKKDNKIHADKDGYQVISGFSREDRLLTLWKGDDLIQVIEGDDLANVFWLPRKKGLGQQAIPLSVQVNGEWQWNHEGIIDYVIQHPEEIENITEQDLPEGQNIIGDTAFFFSNESVAETYSGSREKVKPSQDVPFGGTPGNYPVYLSLQNPLIIELNEPKPGHKPQTWNEPIEGYKNAPEFIDAVRKEGKYDGVIIKNIWDEGAFSDSAYLKPSTVHAVFKPTQIKSATDNQGTFDPADPNIYKQDVKGSITFSDEGAFLRLAEASDLSTFLHEAGHLFLEMETKTVGEEVTPDQQAILDWLEVDSFDQIETKHHEKWARGFEAYLMEGKAPSIELQFAFRRFAEWLKTIYKNFIGLEAAAGQPIGLSDEVRQVMARMLATDEQMAEVEATNEYAELFTSAAEMGMTPSEYADYKKKAQKAKDKPREGLQQRILKQLRRTYEKTWRDETKELAGTHEEQLMNEPVYKAKTFLSDKVDPDAPIPNRLNTEIVKEMFGGKVPPALRKMVNKDSPLSPDDAANFFGYKSGKEMLDEIVAARPIKEVAKEAANQQMLDKYGDILHDGTLEQEAQLLAHDKERGELLLTEMRILARKTNTQAIDRKLIKEMAIQKIANMPVGQIRPDVYRRAEVRAAQNAVKAMAEGDTVGALAFKKQQVVNFHMYRQARFAKEKSEKLRKRHQDLKARKYNPKKVNPDFIAHMKLLAAAFDFRKTNKDDIELAQARLNKVNAWIQDQLNHEERPAPIMTHSVLTEIKHWSDLTLAELQGLDDVLKSLRYTGGLMSDEALAIEREQQQKVGDAIRETFKNKKKRAKKGSGERERKDFWNHYSSFIFLHASQLLRKLDGFKEGGIVYNTIKKPIDLAVSQVLVPMQEKAGKDMSDLYEKYYERSELRAMNKPQQVAGKELTKWEMISLALNWGNESSREAILNDKHNTWSEESVKAVLDTLDQKDWDFVQDVWDYIGSYWPAMAALEKRRKGIVPMSVEPVEVPTKFGTYRGGYYPLSYDAEESIKVNNEKAEDMMKSVMQTKAASARTRDGMLQERIGSGKRPVDLNIMVFHKHINEVITLLALTETVDKVQRVLASQAFKEAMEDTQNQDIAHGLNAWLKDVAIGEIVAGKGVEKQLRRLRAGFSAAAIGYNIGTILMQPLGILNSLPVVGYGNILRGMTALALNPIGKGGAIYKVQAKSAFMRERALTFNKDIRDALHEMKGSPHMPGWLPDGFGPSMYAGIVFTQRYVDTATWLGAYEQAKQVLPDNATEEDLVHFSDQQVARTQASGVWADRTPIERGTASENIRQTEWVRMWTALGSYFFAKGNVTHELISKTDFKNPVQDVKLIVDLMVMYTVEAMLVAAIRGTLPDDDDDESMLAFATSQTVSAVMGSMPLLREFSSEAEGFRSGPTFTKFVERVGRTLTQTDQALDDSEQLFDTAMVKAINNVGGMWFKYPSGAMNRIYESWIEDAEGEDVDLIDYLMYREK